MSDRCQGVLGRSSGPKDISGHLSSTELKTMSGQSIMDRVAAAKHSIAGQGLAKSVCKATTEEIIGPKKKHLDCEYGRRSIHAHQRVVSRPCLFYLKINAFNFALHLIDGGVEVLARCLLLFILLSDVRCRQKLICYPQEHQGIELTQGHYRHEAGDVFCHSKMTV